MLNKHVSYAQEIFARYENGLRTQFGRLSVLLTVHFALFNLIYRRTIHKHTQTDRHTRAQQTTIGYRVGLLKIYKEKNKQ